MHHHRLLANVLQVAQIRHRLLLENGTHGLAHAHHRSLDAELAKEDAVRRLFINHLGSNHLIVVQEENATTIVEVNGFGVNRGEHALEGRRHQLQRLVVLRKVVQHQRIEEGRLRITLPPEKNRRVDSLAVNFEDVAAQRILLDLGVRNNTDTNSKVKGRTLGEAADAHARNHLSLADKNDVRNSVRTSDVHIILHTI